MSVLSIELNDAGILGVHESRPSTEVIPPSPGFALLDGDDLRTGAAALRRARLQPRWAVSRFWETLDTSPLPRPFPRRLTHADLVHAHLDGIWKSVASEVDDVILAVPGWYSGEQLGLILGIARSCGMPVHGMIDSAVAASSTVTEGEKRIHLDLHLHRTAATALTRKVELHRRSIEVLTGLGLISLWDDWVELISQLFIRKTRFDPLHLASTEQGLYLSLPQWLDRLREEDVVVIVMEASNKEYSIELHRDEVVEYVSPRYEAIDQLARSLRRPEEKVTLLLSDRLSRLPGLVEALSADPDWEVISLPATAAAGGALRAKELILSPRDREELTFVTRLPLEVGVDRAPSLDAPRGGARPEPTHILIDGVAHRVTSEPFFLGASIPAKSRGIAFAASGEAATESYCSVRRLDDRIIVEGYGECPVHVNGKKVDGPAALEAGDHLRVGSPGVEVQLIQVKD